MSTQGRIKEFLFALAKDSKPDEWIAITPDRIASETGFGRQAVNQTLYSLMTTGHIELQKAANKRNIIGFRVLPDRVDKRRQLGGRRMTRVPASAMDRAMENPRPSLSLGGRRPTPAIDAYATAKQRFERLQAEMGDYMDATFREHPVAEEGLYLRQRLDNLEPLVRSLRERAETAEAELASLRGRRQQELTKAAVEAGAVAVHSTD